MDAKFLFSPVFEGNRNMPSITDGGGILGDLVSLGEDGVKIIFSCEEVFPSDMALGGQSHPDGILKQLFINYRKRSRMTQRDRIHLGIGLGAKCRRVGGKRFAEGR